MRDGRLTLRDHCETALGVLLETLVHEGVAARKNVEDDLGQGLSLVADSSATIGDSDWNILTASLVVNYGVAVLNLTTMTSVGLNEDVDEVANDLVIGGTSHDDKAP